MEALHTLSRNDQIYYREKYEDISTAQDDISEDGRAVTEDEYWEKYYEHPDFNYEWNNGYLEVNPVSDFSGYLMYEWFTEILRHYFRVNPIGVTVGLEIGFRLALPDKKSIRKPDLAVILNNNPEVIQPDDCTYTGTYDLCIEALSYSSRKGIKRDTVVKKKEYQGIGVREYYILDARGFETAFFRRNSKGKYEKIQPQNKGIIRSGVLPGFQFRVSDLHRQPSLEELAQDDVYHKYVLPAYRDAQERAKKEKRRAERAEQNAAIQQQRAEKEQRRAEQEKQRAERAEKQLLTERRKAEKLAAKLREVGISSSET